MNKPSQGQPGDQSQEQTFAELDALLAEPAGEKATSPQTDDSPEEEFDDLGVLIDRSGYQGLPGAPSTSVAGKKYVCPTAGCATEWFRQGLRTPPLCEEHGVVLIPSEDVG
mgnify:CR=1 FL=1